MYYSNVVLGKFPPQKIALPPPTNTNSNPKPKPNPNLTGGNIPRGKLSGHPLI